MTWNAIAVLVTVAGVSVAGAQSVETPLSMLALKATHNSYASECDGIFFCNNDAPYPNHPPIEQLDGFGVWAFELDFSVIVENGRPRAIVGHNGPDGDATWAHSSWGRYLEDYLVPMRDSRSLHYRPLIVYLEKKNWGTPADDPYREWASWEPVLEQAIQSVFCDEDCAPNCPAARCAVFGPDGLGEKWPSVPRLAGEFVAVTWSNENDDDGRSFPGSALVFAPNQTRLKRESEGGCADLDLVQGWVDSEANILATDQYQADWTFYSPSQAGWGNRVPVPSNPLYVAFDAPAESLVTDGVGEPWSCASGDAKSGTVVSAQGTFRFPLSRLSDAIDRLDQTQAGWTILIKPGSYYERLTISKPLVLERDDSIPGVVQIGP